MQCCRKHFVGYLGYIKLVLLPQTLTMLLHQRFPLTQFHKFHSLMDFSSWSCFLFVLNFYIGQSRTWSTIVDFPCTMSPPIDRVLYSIAHHSSLLRLSKGPWGRFIWWKSNFHLIEPFACWNSHSWHFCFFPLCYCINIQQWEVLQDLPFGWQFSTEHNIWLGEYFGECSSALEIANSFKRIVLAQSFLSVFQYWNISASPRLKAYALPPQEQREY